MAFVRESTAASSIAGGSRTEYRGFRDVARGGYWIRRLAFWRGLRRLWRIPGTGAFFFEGQDVEELIAEFEGEEDTGERGRRVGVGSFY